MNPASYVSQKIAEMKSSGMSLQRVTWEAAKLCIGWPYVFGARGDWCDPSNRRRYYQSHGDEHPTIKTSCRNFDGSDNVVGKCSGCKWYPGSRVRCFDCRGFTYWLLYEVYGWKLMGGGCTSQWNNAANWKAKGRVADGIPADTLVCLFYSKNNKEVTWEHTGFGYNGETVECSVNVQYSSKINRKWTHWAIPACVVEPPSPTPTPDPGTTRPTVRRGSRGEDVRYLQTKLAEFGYDIGSSGIDGVFGKQTENAVKQFQTDCGLTADGVCGKDTWKAIEDHEPGKRYTVTIPNLPKMNAESLVNQYTGATMTEEAAKEGE